MGEGGGSLPSPNWLAALRAPRIACQSRILRPCAWNLAIGFYSLRRLSNLRYAGDSHLSDGPVAGRLYL